MPSAAPPPKSPSQAGNEQRTRVIVVANRLPITVRRAKEGSGWSLERSSGGLVSAFLGVRNMDITWVGWPGMAVPAEEQEAVRAELRKTEQEHCDSPAQAVGAGAARVQPACKTQLGFFSSNCFSSN